MPTDPARRREDALLDAMVRLRDAATGAERAMFVLPTDRMDIDVGLNGLLKYPVAWDDAVLLVYRTPLE